MFNILVCKLYVIDSLCILLGIVYIFILNFSQNIEDFCCRINLLLMMYFVDVLYTNIKMFVSFNRHLLYL